MSHDPLCHCHDESSHVHVRYAHQGKCFYCRCDLIARVRADERRRQGIGEAT